MIALVILSNRAHSQLFEDHGGSLSQDLRPTDCIQSQPRAEEHQAVVSSRQVVRTLLQGLGLPLSQFGGCFNEGMLSLPLLFSGVSSL